MKNSQPSTITLHAQPGSRTLPMGILRGGPFTKPIDQIVQVERGDDGRGLVWVKGAEGHPVPVRESYEAVLSRMGSFGNL